MSKITPPDYAPHLRHTREMVRQGLDSFLKRSAQLPGSESATPASERETLQVLLETRDASSFTMFATLMQAVAAASNRTVPRANTDLFVALALYRWALYGTPTFVTTPGLAVGLGLTDPRGIDPDHPLPFPAFAITLPPGLQPEFVATDDNKKCLVDTIFVTDVFAATDTFETLADTKPNGIVEYKAIIQKLRDSDQHRKVVIVAFSSEHEESFVLDCPVEAERPWYHHLGDNIETGADADCAKLCGRIVANMLCYLDQARTPADKPNALPAAIKKTEAGAHRTYHVGREITLQPGVESQIRRAGVSGWKFVNRFMVVGHWRNQAVGKGRAERRRQWIRPFWKGPKTVTDTLERTYRAMEPVPGVVDKKEATS